VGLPTGTFAGSAPFCRRPAQNKRPEHPEQVPEQQGPEQSPEQALEQSPERAAEQAEQFRPAFRRLFRSQQCEVIEDASKRNSGTGGNKKGGERGRNNRNCSARCSAPNNFAALEICPKRNNGTRAKEKPPIPPLRAGGPKAAAREQGADPGGTVPRTGRVGTTGTEQKIDRRGNSRQG
jgi:hypothetical protein